MIDSNVGIEGMCCRLLGINLLHYNEFMANVRVSGGSLQGGWGRGLGQTALQYSSAAAPATANPAVPSNDVTLVGAAAGPVVIHNVGTGSLPNDAVNVAQLGALSTLATNAVAQGLMVVYTGGFSPQDSASPAMRYLATGFIIPAIPNSVICWIIIGAATVFLLTRTAFGRSIYGIGTRERAAYLSGINTRRVVMTVFGISGGLAAFGGVLLAGYASKAAQSMGDAYLLPAIAAVVLGGTSILGGRGSYLGTVAGVLLITLLQSILSVMQMPEYGRQIIYGLVIISMLLLYGREKFSR